MSGSDRRSSASRRAPSKLSIPPRLGGLVAGCAAGLVVLGAFLALLTVISLVTDFGEFKNNLVMHVLITLCLIVPMLGGGVWLFRHGWASARQQRVPAESVIETVRPPAAKPAPAPQPAAPSASALHCAECAKPVEDYHYWFESIIIAELAGSQCSQCGRVLCAEHSAYLTALTFDQQLCATCGGEVILMYRGPGYSSMVEAAERDGRYNQHIRRPGRERVIEQE